MSSTPVAALIIVLTLSAVLLVSGVAKMRDPRATRDAFVALRVPGVVPVDIAAPALPWFEIALAVLLLVMPSGWVTPVALALLLLMLAYTGLVARALTFDDPVSCSCFGSLGRHDVDRLTLARNVLLTLLAAAVVWFAFDGGSTPAAFAAIEAEGWSALLAAGAAAAVAVLVLGGSAATTAKDTHGAVDEDGEPLDYDRHPIPYGVVTLSDGRSATLTELATTQARLLVILNVSCGPCLRIGEQLDAWAEQLDPAVGVLAVYATDEPTVNHADELTAVEPERNLRRVFAVGAPSAVLLGADGQMAGGPVSGEDDVAQFVEDVLAAVAASTAAAE